MKLKIFFTIIVLSLQLAMNAQLKFESNNLVGLVSGSSKNALQVQTVNGLRYKTFFVGAGVGADNYYFKTIPLFADVRKNIFEKKETPFVYVDAGTNFPEKKNESTTWQQSTYHSGLYYDVGIGYKWMIAKQFFVNASFGYSQKEYSSQEKYFYTTIIDPPIPPDRYDYKLQRFTMKLGFGF